MHKLYSTEILLLLLVGSSDINLNFFVDKCLYFKSFFTNLVNFGFDKVARTLSNCLPHFFKGRHHASLCLYHSIVLCNPFSNLIAGL